MAKRRSKKQGSALAVIVAIAVVILGLRALVQWQSSKGESSAKDVIHDLRQDGEFESKRSTPKEPSARKSLIPISKEETDKLSRSDRKELDALLDDVAE